MLVLIWAADLQGGTFGVRNISGGAGVGREESSAMARGIVVRGDAEKADGFVNCAVWRSGGTGTALRIVVRGEAEEMGWRCGSSQMGT